MNAHTARTLNPVKEPTKARNTRPTIESPECFDIEPLYAYFTPHLLADCVPLRKPCTCSPNLRECPACFTWRKEELKKQRRNERAPRNRPTWVITQPESELVTSLTIELEQLKAQRPTNKRQEADWEPEALRTVRRTIRNIHQRLTRLRQRTRIAVLPLLRPEN